LEKEVNLNIIKGKQLNEFRTQEWLTPGFLKSITKSKRTNFTNNWFDRRPASRVHYGIKKYKIS